MFIGQVPFGVQLVNDFRILSWETSFQNDTISGEGSSLGLKSTNATIQKDVESKQKRPA